MFAYNLKGFKVKKKIDKTPSGRTHLKDISTFGLAYERLGRHLHGHGVAVRSEDRRRATKNVNTRLRARRSASATTIVRIARALKYCSSFENQNVTSSSVEDHANAAAAFGRSRDNRRVITRSDEGHRANGRHDAVAAGSQLRTSTRTTTSNRLAVKPKL